MGTIYDLLNTPEHLQLIVQLIRNGIIKDATIIQHMSIYDRFYQITGSKGERYIQLGIEFKKYPDTIKKIMIRLNKMAK